MRYLRYLYEASKRFGQNVVDTVMLAGAICGLVIWTVLGSDGPE